MSWGYELEFHDFLLSVMTNKVTVLLSDGTKLECSVQPLELGASRDERTRSYFELFKVINRLLVSHFRLPDSNSFSISAARKYRQNPCTDLLYGHIVAVPNLSSPKFASLAKNKITTFGLSADNWQGSHIVELISMPLPNEEVEVGGQSLRNKLLWQLSVFNLLYEAAEGESYLDLKPHFHCLPLEAGHLCDFYTNAVGGVRVKSITLELCGLGLRCAAKISRRPNYYLQMTGTIDMTHFSQKETFDNPLLALLPKDKPAEIDMFSRACALSEEVRETLLAGGNAVITDYWHGTLACMRYLSLAITEGENRRGGAGKNYFTLFPKSSIITHARQLFSVMVPRTIYRDGCGYVLSNSGVERFISCCEQPQFLRALVAGLNTCNVTSSYSFARIFAYIGGEGAYGSGEKALLTCLNGNINAEQFMLGLLFSVFDCLHDEFVTTTSRQRAMLTVQLKRLAKLFIPHLKIDGATRNHIDACALLANDSFGPTTARIDLHSRPGAGHMKWERRCITSAETFAQTIDRIATDGQHWHRLGQSALPPSMTHMLPQSPDNCINEDTGRRLAERRRYYSYPNTLPRRRSRSM